MITLILKMVFLTSSWVMMWKIATAKEMVLESVGNWGEKMAKKYKIFDGLIVCPWCLPNIHGILFVWPLAFLIGVMPCSFVWWKYLALYPFCLGGSCFVSGMLWLLYETTNRKKDYYESAGKINDLQIADYLSNNEIEDKK